MPDLQDEFQKDVQKILEVAMFENWLRFYFIQERKVEGAEDPELIIKLSDKSLERIREHYPEFLPMAEGLNNKPINFEASKNAVLQHILTVMDGKALEKGSAQRVLQSSTFQTKLQLFHTWEQMHEDQLEAGFLDFGTWLSLFGQWLETPGARELAKKLLHAG